MREPPVGGNVLAGLKRQIVEGAQEAVPLQDRSDGRAQMRPDLDDPGGRRILVDRRNRIFAQLNQGAVDDARGGVAHILVSKNIEGGRDAPPPAFGFNPPRLCLSSTAGAGKSDRAYCAEP